MRTRLFQLCVCVVMHVCMSIRVCLSVSPSLYIRVLFFVSLHVSLCDGLCCCCVMSACLCLCLVRVCVVVVVSCVVLICLGSCWCCFVLVYSLFPCSTFLGIHVLQPDDVPIYTDMQSSLMLPQSESDHIKFDHARITVSCDSSIP